MKPTFFDMEMPDKECAKFLEQTLHAPLEELGEADESCVYKTCHQVFGMCRDTPCCQTAAAFVRCFNHSLSDNGIKTGELMSATVGDCGESCLFFLGVCVKKPHVHILFHTEIGSDGFCSYLTEAGRPKLSTSQQLFQGFLSRSSEPIRQISIELWSYSPVYDPTEQPFLRFEVGNSKKAFTVDLDATRPRKTRFKLPFGLKARRAPRKKALGTKAKTLGRKRGPAKNPGAVAGVLGATRKQRQPKQKQSSSTSTTSSGSTSESDSDSSSQTQSQSVEGFVRDVGLEDHEAEEAEVAPISTEAKKEERLAQQLDAEQENLKALAMEKSNANTATATVANDTGAGSSTDKKGPVKGSFFSKEIGVDQVAIAVSGRSVCYHCKNKIQKGSVRYSFFHSTLRPSAWVHSTCLTPLVRAENCIHQAKGKLSQFTQTFDALANQSPQTAALANSVATALKEIAGE